MGTASAPNAMAALGFAKETARLGMKHLKRYAGARGAVGTLNHCGAKCRSIALCV